MAVNDAMNHAIEMVGRAACFAHRNGLAEPAAAHVSARQPARANAEALVIPISPPSATARYG